MKKTILILIMLILSFSLVTSDNFGYKDTNVPVILSKSAVTSYTSGSNVTNFLDLLDTPSSYSGQGTNCVKVNAGENALEFGSCGGGGGGVGDKWVDLGSYISPNSTYADNVIVSGYIRANDWTNVTITESQITDLSAHNPFDQNLNTTEDVQFDDLTLTGDISLEPLTSINLSNPEGFSILSMRNPAVGGIFQLYVYGIITSNSLILSPNITATDIIRSANKIQAADWSNVTITESQITDLAHTIDTNASTICSGDEVLLGDGSCTSSSTFGGTTNTNYTFNPVVGVTSSSVSGNMSRGANIGYVSANAMCNGNFSGSHLCLEIELMKVHTYNITNLGGQYWIAKGAPGYTANANDCEGWSKETGEIGPFWDYTENGGVGAGKLTPCSSNLQLLCCRG